MKSIPSSRGFSVSSQMLTVVKDGLVLNVDAGDINSYPGTGVTWSDRSTQANSLTLTNGPSFNTTTSSNISFDGVDDYAVDNGNATLKAISNGGNYSVDAWLKLNSISGTYYLCGNQNAQAGSYGFGIVLAPISSVVRPFYTTSSSSGFFALPVSGGFTTSWMHFVLTDQYNDGSSQRVTNLYINSTLNNSVTSSTPVGTVSNSANSFRIGLRPNGTLPMPANVASLKIYNRIISQNEVTQNYNALRGRFGL